MTRDIRNTKRKRRRTMSEELSDIIIKLFCNYHYCSDQNGKQYPECSLFIRQIYRSHCCPIKRTNLDEMEKELNVWHIRERKKWAKSCVPYHFYGCDCPKGLVGEHCGRIRAETLKKIEEG